MASNPANNPPSKSLSINSPKQIPSPGLSTGDLATQRRSPLGGGPNGSGNVGAGRHTRTTSTPRNSQSSRKRNKQTNKPHRHEGSERLNEVVDHALSESVRSLPSNEELLTCQGNYASSQQPKRPKHYAFDEFPTAASSSAPSSATTQAKSHGRSRFRLPCGR
jgi:hypothetical protein